MTQQQSEGAQVYKESNPFLFELTDNHLWDWYAGMALTGAQLRYAAGSEETMANHASLLADAMMAEMEKRRKK